MGTKKQNERIEAVRNAATGYATVVLGVLCFILALVVVMAGVRVVVGAGTSGAATSTTVVAGTSVRGNGAA